MTELLLGRLSVRSFIRRKIIIIDLLRTMQADTSISDLNAVQEMMYLLFWQNGESIREMM